MFHFRCLSTFSLKSGTMDVESLDVLKTIAKFSGQVTWYPLAKKTKQSIRGLLFSFEEQGLIFSEEKFLIDKDRTERYYSITKCGLEKIIQMDAKDETLVDSVSATHRKPPSPENPE